MGHGGKGCKCTNECTDQTRTKCKVTEVPDKECKTVKKDEDVIDCKTKCYKADKVISINKSHGKGECGCAQDGRARSSWGDTGVTVATRLLLCCKIEQTEPGE